MPASPAHNLRALPGPIPSFSKKVAALADADAGENSEASDASTALGSEAGKALPKEAKTSADSFAFSMFSLDYANGPDYTAATKYKVVQVQLGDESLSLFDFSKKHANGRNCKDDKMKARAGWCKYVKDLFSNGAFTRIWDDEKTPVTYFVDVLNASILDYTIAEDSLRDEIERRLESIEAGGK